MTQNNQAHAVFMSYNSIGQNGEHTNGTFERHGRTVTILQHPKGQRWAGTVGNQPPLEGRLAAGMSDDEMDWAVSVQRQATVATLERELADVPGDIDFLVIYVGAGGSEGAIELASRYPRDKVRFVLCDCNLEYKMFEIARMFRIACPLDFNIPVLVCECGGQRTMGALVNNFIQTGRVGPPASG